MKLHRFKFNFYCKKPGFLHNTGVAILMAHKHQFMVTYTARVGTRTEEENQIKLSRKV